MLLFNADALDAKEQLYTITSQTKYSLHPNEMLRTEPAHTLACWHFKTGITYAVSSCAGLVENAGTQKERIPGANAVFFVCALGTPVCCAECAARLLRRPHPMMSRVLLTGCGCNSWMCVWLADDGCGTATVTVPLVYNIQLSHMSQTAAALPHQAICIRNSPAQCTPNTCPACWAGDSLFIL